MTSLVIRALEESEARTVFTSLPDAGLVGRPLLGRAYDTLSAGGEYRPEWTWVAERDGVVVARAAYWAAPEDDEPLALDWFDCPDREAGVALLRAMPHRPEYQLMLPPGWRTDARVRAEAENRIEAAQLAGYQTLVERFTYLWTPADGLPERPGRLHFRPEPDDEVVREVLTRIQEGTLDAHDRALGDPAKAAREELEFLNWCPSPRDWWRLAYTPEGDVVGFQAPAHNPHRPIVGFVGVLPEHRGHGFAYDLLVECTHQLVAEGAKEIAAATDLDNEPMAAAFARAGYPLDQHRYCMVHQG